jgi:hypothetical protein
VIPAAFTFLLLLLSIVEASIEFGEQGSQVLLSETGQKYSKTDGAI